MENSRIIGSRQSREDDNKPSLNDQADESLSKEWTDEKHSLYLKTMEASFVTELYSSMSMHERHSQKTNQSDIKSSEKAQIRKHSPSYEFKVLHCGCWQKINYERVRPQVNRRGEARRLLANPWIQHFRSARKPALVSSQKDSQSTRQEINLNEEPMSVEADSTSKPFPEHHSQSCDQDMVISYTEMSDQNFVDEDIILTSNDHSLERKEKPQLKKL